MVKSGFVASIIIMLAVSSCDIGRGSAQNSPSAQGDIVLETTLVRRLDDSMLPRDSNKCERWDYDEGKFAVDFGRMREVGSEDWGRLCYTYACSYTGSAIYENHPYRVEVNAGGWMVLSSSEDQSSRFFISDEKLAPFLDTCDCCENQPKGTN